MQTLFTIGYEKVLLSDFIITLQQHAINVLLDVRECPISRRKGFSKNALREAVEAAGIHYQHEKSLGAPKPLRDQLKHDHDYRTFFRKYKAYLTPQSDWLEQMANSLTGRVALVCYERDYRECHRLIIAETLCTQLGLHPIHLKVAMNGPQRTHSTVHIYSGQSLSST